MKINLTRGCKNVKVCDFKCDDLDIAHTFADWLSNNTPFTLMAGGNERTDEYYLYHVVHLYDTADVLDQVKAHIQRIVETDTFDICDMGISNIKIA